MNFESELSKARLLKIQELLRGQALTTAELADELGVTSKYALFYVMHLRENNQIHIESKVRYAPTERGTPRFRWGPSVEGAEIKCESVLQLKPSCAEFVPHRDPLVAALFGEPKQTSP